MATIVATAWLGDDLFQHGVRVTMVESKDSYGTGATCSYGPHYWTLTPLRTPSWPVDGTKYVAILVALSLLVDGWWNQNYVIVLVIIFITPRSWADTCVLLNRDPHCTWIQPHLPLCTAIVVTRPPRSATWNRRLRIAPPFFWFVVCFGQVRNGRAASCYSRHEGVPRCVSRPLQPSARGDSPYNALETAQSSRAYLPSGGTSFCLCYCPAHLGQVIDSHAPERLRSDASF